jgi:hypothetical protein
MTTTPLEQLRMAMDLLDEAERLCLHEERQVVIMYKILNAMDALRCVHDKLQPPLDQSCLTSTSGSKCIS